MYHRARPSRSAGTRVGGNTLLRRMIGAASLKADIFEEIEADPKATLQAVVIVVAVSIVTGLAAAQINDGGTSTILLGILTGIAGWAIWAAITYFVGTTLFKTKETEATWGQLARVIGFGQTPGLFRILGLIPTIGGALYLVASLWQLAAMVIGVRQALDYTSTWRAVGVVVVGFIPYAVFQFLLISLLGNG